MTIRHLNIFIAVCDQQSISKAAKSLFIAQPTVSQAIKEIEKQFDVILFERLSNKLYITKKGEDMLSYARHISSSFTEMEEKIKGNTNSLLKIGATITVATCVLNKWLNVFNLQNKNVNTKIVVDNTKEIEQLILESKIDIAIVEGKIKSTSLIKTSVMKDELVLICNQNHFMAKQKQINFYDLENLDFIFREIGSGTREIFDDELKKHNIQVNEKWTCNNSEAIKNAVKQSDCLSVISKMLVEDDENLHIVPIKNIRFVRDFYLTYHKNKYISSAIQNFRNLVGDNND